ncbi:MAG: NADH-quinone oxidoreductase subunit M [Deltaproteobacteria bacterium]|nr:NADH-quinone oxidoreductase subunit M [Deltaproteobacteria bacterium]
MATSLDTLLADHLLSAIVFLPLATVLLLALADGLFRLPETIWRYTALASSLVGLLLALALWQRFDPASSGMQLVERAEWIPSWGIHYSLGIDGIALLLVALTSFLLPVVLLASWTDIHARVKSYLFFMLALQTGMLGAFLALNLFLFYVFWELMLIPMYFVIGIWGGPRRIYATLKFFIYTMVGSLLMLVGILVLAWLHQSQFGSPSFEYYGANGGTGILDLSIPNAGGPWWQRQGFLFGVFALAFAIKVPMFPFHTWLPDAHVEAPTPGSAVLAGVLLKLGTFGFVRYALPLFPQAALDFAPWIVGLAVIGIVYGALVAWVQSDLKKLVAYSSVSHMGFIVLGLFALNPQGVSGAVLQMVSHGVSTGALFILVGMIYERRHVRELDAFGGLAQAMPVFAAFFAIATFSSVGLPGLNGFVGEFLILLGAFQTLPGATVIATSGVILSAVYMLWAMRRVFFGPLANEANKTLVDLGLREKLVAVALVIPMIWIGVHPSTFTNPMDRAVTELLETMTRRGADLAAWQGRDAADEPRLAAEAELETSR